jgi:hypothetical protein
MAGVLNTVTPPIIGVSSLAVGADQLFASLVIQFGGQVRAVIPFAGYERTFGPQEVVTYHKLLSAATEVEIMQTDGTDEDCYLAAGKRVVDLADFMVTVWNELPAKGKGGTADIVAYATEKRKRLINLNPMNCAVSTLCPGSRP